MSARNFDLERVRSYLHEFAEVRDWVRFHTPKNLAMALAAEAGELLEIFQWMTPEESEAIEDPRVIQAIRDEIADVLQYLIRLADVMNVDIEEALWEKLETNRDRFPV